MSKEEALAIITVVNQAIINLIKTVSNKLPISSRLMCNVFVSYFEEDLTDDTIILKFSHLIEDLGGPEKTLTYIVNKDIAGLLDSGVKIDYQVDLGVTTYDCDIIDELRKFLDNTTINPSEKTEIVNLASATFHLIYLKTLEWQHAYS
jgi:hypothetical protein